MSVAEAAEPVAFARAALEAGAGFLTVSLTAALWRPYPLCPAPKSSLFPLPCSVPWALGLC